MIRIGLLFLGTFVLEGCRVPAEPPLSVAASQPQAIGSASFHVVEAPLSVPEQPTNADIRTNFCSAIPRYPLIDPAYPKKALAAHAGWAVIGVRILIDEKGTVSDVQPSMLTITTPVPFAKEFRAAVDAAVFQWRFQPALIQVYQRLTAPGVSKEQWKLLSSNPTRSATELSFTFTSTGEVTAGPSK
jgi:outer membrane biosynthesis protein TonB